MEDRDMLRIMDRTVHVFMVRETFRLLSERTYFSMKQNLCYYLSFDIIDATRHLLPTNLHRLK
jgi:hypothetical protein